MNQSIENKDDDTLPRVVDALWNAEFDSFDIARMAGASEADVARLIATRRERQRERLSHEQR